MTPSDASVRVHADAELLAKSVAARLITRLVDAQAERGSACVALTGGGIGTAVLREVATAPARDAVDWRRLDVWWSDERFLPTGDAERNETAARSALLDHVNVDPERVHPMPAPGGSYGDDPAGGAQRYASALREAAGESAGFPRFDVCLLGVGPDAHVASLFPDHSASREEDQLAVALRDAPKPPPQRVTLTFPVLRGAREVWLVASGGEKADAVARSLDSTAGGAHVPAAGARGSERTLLLVDRPAARKLPPAFTAPSVA
ncbi:6-phosphogluconolactonase [Haloactinospora alba]|uniref:6-phosphogluconolactonase n=1 Tax=Haloactinospora alba TaxID=405555 RepID=A0A543NHR2_9ACTN|nr:6-phosphogluconolactonase [Haloactinospora alba]TQN31382.1 6-phosphogluconolactonase [Haloactinospora alba]